jgi:redox-sensing transcriptional repressor
MVSRKSVARISLYRRLLDDLQAAGATHVYSHQLARLAGVTAAQVRRDFMAIGYSGSPARGYELDQCLASVSSFLDGSQRGDVALVGVGRLGQSILAHFADRRPMLKIVVAFDTDPSLVGTAINGCHCHSVDRMEDVVRDLQVRIAILAVPADHAQAVAASLVRAGVRSIVSFAPVPLRVPDDVFVDYIDITTALESAAFFARVGMRRPVATESAAGNETAAVLRDIEPLLASSNITLEELATRIGATVLTRGRPGATTITRVYAGDRVSDLLNEASAETLLVTNLVSVQMLRVAELMDVPGICFVENVIPEPDIIDVAKANNTLVMVSPQGVYETCGLLYSALATADQPVAG